MPKWVYSGLMPAQGLYRAAPAGGAPIPASDPRGWQTVAPVAAPYSEAFDMPTALMMPAWPKSGKILWRPLAGGQMLSALMW